MEQKYKVLKSGMVGGAHHNRGDMVYLERPTKNELKVVQLISKAKVVPDIDPKPTVGRITAIIKTFERPQCARRLVESLRYYYPKMPIILADDGKKPQRLIYPDLEYHALPYDSGLSAGRNMMVQRVKTEMFLLLDDDFVFDQRTDINKLIEAIDDGFDIAAGSVDSMEYNGLLEREGNELLYIKGDRGILAGRPLYDMVLNFFVGRTSKFQGPDACLWDEELKLAEHTAFFFENKGKLKITSIPEVKVGHLREQGPEYETMRLRGPSFVQVFMKKHGFKKIVNFKGNVTSLKGPPVDFLCDMAHYVDHARGLWQFLNAAGNFFIKEGVGAPGLKGVVRYAKSDLPAKLSANPDRPIVVFSRRHVELASMHRSNVILANHGIGQFYETDHKFWGAPDFKGKVAFYLAPNELSAAWARKHGIPCEIVGVPKLDTMLANVKPTIALSFHWQAESPPEVKSCYDLYKDIIPLLKEKYTVLGHGHPRLLDEISPYYRNAGIEIVESFEQVVRRADLYICDNSSTIYEFAASGKPVLLLNHPDYRKNVTHPFNPRFWKYADVGLQCDHPDQLMDTIEKALDDPEEVRVARRRAVEAVCPFRGDSVRRATEAILANV